MEKKVDVEELKSKVYALLEKGGVSERGRVSIMNCIDADLDPHWAWKRGQCDGLR